VEPGSAVTVGRVVRPHGLTGETVVRETSLSAGDFAELEEVDLVRPDGASLGTFVVDSVRQFGTALLVRFAGVDDVDKAGGLRGARVTIGRDRLPAIAENEIYHVDLIGLDVVEEGGRSLGRVTRVLPTGAHEVLEVRGDENTLLIPYHPGVILGWDPDAGRLDVRLPEGLEDVYKSEEPKQKKPRRKKQS
jgi:16S rRNA processing protein RimM